MLQFLVTYVLTHTQISQYKVISARSSLHFSGAICKNWPPVKLKNKWGAAYHRSTCLLLLTVANLNKLAQLAKQLVLRDWAVLARLLLLQPMKTCDKHSGISPISHSVNFEPKILEAFFQYSAFC